MLIMLNMKTFCFYVIRHEIQDEWIINEGIFFKDVVKSNILVRCFVTYIPFYLAQKLCFWTGIIFIRVYVSVCLCVSFYIDYLKKFLTDLDETWQDGVL